MTDDESSLNFKIGLTQGYVDTQGDVHKTAAAAVCACREINLHRWVRRTGLGSGGEWSPSMIADAMVARIGDLVTILDPSNYQVTKKPQEQ